jgi:hypothetical protein
VLAAVGVFLLAGSVYVATGPGRIDIIDGQYRFEVARNLLDDGSMEVRDPFLAGAVTGLAGVYSPYGISGSIAPLPLLMVARSFGAPSIDRQQFFFSFTSSLFGAATAALLILFYGSLGVARRTALFWTLVAAFGTLAFPAATTTFDQTQHAFLILAACYLAFIAGRRESIAAAAAGGVALAILVNFQETYIILFPTVGLATLAPHGATAAQRRRGFERFVVMMVVGCVGLVVWSGLNQFRFGNVLFSGKGQNHPPALGNPLVGLTALLFSPGKSIFLYSPATAIAAVGVYHLTRRERLLGLGVAATAVAYLGLMSMLSFYGGDWSWGPRYFVVILPILALGFPFVRVTSPRERALVRTIIAAGVVVQVLALTIDHHRFFYARSLPPFFWYEQKDIYFRESALASRVGELVDSLRHGVPPEAEQFRPGPYPELLTYAVFGDWEQAKLSAPAWMRRYAVFWLARPWPLWMITIPRDKRPINVEAMSAILLAMAMAGIFSIRCGLRSASTTP